MNQQPPRSRARSAQPTLDTSDTGGDATLAATSTSCEAQQGRLSREQPAAPVSHTRFKWLGDMLRDPATQSLEQRIKIQRVRGSIP